MMKATRFLVLATASVAMLACSSASKSTTPEKDAGGSRDAAKDAPREGASHHDGGDGGEQSLASLCATVFGAEAKLFSACLSGPLASWQASLDATSACAKLEAAVTAGTVKYDPASASACVAAVTGLTCTATSAQADGGMVNGFSACGMALSGTVAPGDACTFDLECTGDSYCSGLIAKNPPCTGTCAAKIAKDKPCVVGDECESGYYCGGKPGSLTCIAVPTETLAAKGDACGYDKTTKATTKCQPALVCNAVTKVCVVPVAEGDACTQGAGECANFTYCNATTEKCTADPGPGGACGVEVKEDPITCAPPAYCKLSSKSSSFAAGKCTAPGATGDACFNGAECASGRCDIGDGGAGTCLAACAAK